MPKDTEPYCPNCKSCEVVPFLGVLPGFAPYDTADRSKIPAAECADTEEAEELEWECKDCKHQWTAKKAK